MSEPFAAYSRYYDLLYRDKDYIGESKYICRLIDRFGPGAVDVLELGCGTGKHANLLADSGFKVTGVERSEGMIRRYGDGREDVKIVQGDARSVRLDQEFDVVLSLFHVVSYQQTDDDVTRMFATVSDHLRGGGIFVFDVWYGPAVLKQRPERRVKTMEDDLAHVVRVAEPNDDLKNHTVDVQYDVTVTSKVTGRIERFSETHNMRYFFQAEIERFATAAGMEVLHQEQWLEGNQPSEDTWGVCFVLKSTSHQKLDGLNCTPSKQH